MDAPSPLLNEIPKRFPLKRDALGALVLTDMDPGDAPQNDGMVAVAMRLMGLPCPEFIAALPCYEIAKSGIGRRHPMIHWEPEDFSRDQQRGLLWGCAFQANFRAEEPYGTLKRMVWEHVKRFGKYQNTKETADWAHPGNFGEYVRMFYMQREWKWWYHLLILTKPFFDMVIPTALLIFFTHNWWWLTLLGLAPDTYMIIDSIVLCFFKDKNPDECGEDKNHLLQICGARFSFESLFSRFARWMFFKFRPVGFGSYYSSKAGEEAAKEWFKSPEKFKIVEPNTVQASLNWYYRPETKNNPVNEYWRWPLWTHFK